MSQSPKWNDEPFIPNDAALPAYKEHWQRPGDNAVYQWYLAEIRQRRAAKVTENEVIGWLNSEGLDSATITWLLVWAETDESVPMPHAPLPPGIVIGVETHSHSTLFTRGMPIVPAATRIDTDPVESLRARVDARRERALASGEEVHDAPAPEFRFAKPADADQAWRDQHVYDMGNVVKGMILVVIITIVMVLSLIALAVA